MNNTYNIGVVLFTAYDARQIEEARTVVYDRLDAILRSCPSLAMEEEGLAITREKFIEPLPQILMAVTVYSDTSEIDTMGCAHLINKNMDLRRAVKQIEEYHIRVDECGSLALRPYWYGEEEEVYTNFNIPRCPLEFSSDMDAIRLEDFPVPDKDIMMDGDDFDSKEIPNGDFKRILSWVWKENLNVWRR